MTMWLLKRVFQAVIVILAMSMIVFVGMHLVGDPVDVLLTQESTHEDRARLIESLGLDQPLWLQYFNFLGSALQGELGNSFVYNTPAVTLILQRLPATLELAFSALFIAIIIGVPLGLYSGMKPTHPLGRLITTGSILGFSLPTFWVGLLMIMVFSVSLGWLPASGRGDTVRVFGAEWSFLTWDGLRHLFLPALNLSLFKASMVIRARSSATRTARSSIRACARSPAIPTSPNTRGCASGSAGNRATMPRSSSPRTSCS